MNKQTSKVINQAYALIASGSDDVAARSLSAAHRCGTRTDQRAIENEISALGVWHLFARSNGALIVAEGVR